MTGNLGFQSWFDSTDATAYASTWHDWNISYTTACSNETTQATIQYQNAWIEWNASYSTQTAVTTAAQTQAWLCWNHQAFQGLSQGLSAYQGGAQGGAIYNAPPTAEEAAEQRRRRAEAEAELQRSHKEAQEARARAAALLREFLDDHQRDTLEKHKWFEVVSPKGRRFRIKQGRAGNVFLIEGGHQVMRYCIHPVSVVPDEDTMLAQALMIRCSEDVFETVANKTPLRAAA